MLFRSTDFDDAYQTYSSPLNNMGNAPIAYKEVPRTSFLNVVTNPTASGNLVVDFYILAPVLTPPFIQNGDLEKAFVRSNVLRMTVNMAGTTGFEIFSSCADSGAFGCTPNGAGTYTNTTFNFLYSTIDVANVPRVMDLQCYDGWTVDYYEQSGAAMNASATVQLNISQKIGRAHV